MYVGVGLGAFALIVAAAAATCWYSRLGERRLRRAEQAKARQQLAALAARLNPGEEVGSSSEDAPPLYAQAEGSTGLPPAWGCDGESSTVQGVAFTSPSAAVRGEPVPQAAPTGPATQDI